MSLATSLNSTLTSTTDPDPFLSVYNGLQLVYYPSMPKKVLIELYIQSACYAILLVLCIASLGWRWWKGNRVFFTVRAGHVVPGTSLLFLGTFTLLLSFGQAFIWQMIKIYRDSGTYRGIVIIRALFWNCQAVCAFYVVWGLLCFSNYNIRSHRPMGRSAVALFPLRKSASAHSTSSSQTFLPPVFFNSIMISLPIAFTVTLMIITGITHARCVDAFDRFVSLSGLVLGASQQGLKPEIGNGIDITQEFWDDFGAFGGSSDKCGKWTTWQIGIIVVGASVLAIGQISGFILVYLKMTAQLRVLHLAATRKQRVDAMSAAVSVPYSAQVNSDSSPSYFQGERSTRPPLSSSVSSLKRQSGIWDDLEPSTTSHGPHTDNKEASLFDNSPAIVQSTVSDASHSYFREVEAARQAEDPVDSQQMTRISPWLLTHQNLKLLATQQTAEVSRNKDTHEEKAKLIKDARNNLVMQMTVMIAASINFHALGGLMMGLGSKSQTDSWWSGMTTTWNFWIVTALGFPTMLTLLAPLFSANMGASFIGNTLPTRREDTEAIQAEQIAHSGQRLYFDYPIEEAVSETVASPPSSSAGRTLVDKMGGGALRKTFSRGNDTPVSPTTTVSPRFSRPPPTATSVGSNSPTRRGFSPEGSPRRPRVVSWADSIKMDRLSPKPQTRAFTEDGDNDGFVRSRTVSNETKRFSFRPSLSPNPSSPKL